jgi:hypothetical protein
MWVYSKLGAASYHPKAGWVEGWAFGNGKPPGIPRPSWSLARRAAERDL